MTDYAEKKSTNWWEKLYGASRRRKDRALLAALEREIANEEKLRKDPVYLRRMTAAEADAMPVRQVTEEQRQRIAAAFGRPI